MNTRVVLVDLSTEEVSAGECPQPLLDAWLGGRGLSDYILLKCLGPAVGPLDPDNLLIFSAGLLGGSAMITSGRVHVSARSPLTGLIGTSNSGGMFGSELCACGIAALVIKGKARRPVFLHIRDDRVSLGDALAARGLPMNEAAAKLRELAGDRRARVAVVGPAGENQVRLASIMFGPGHACGRTGLGAVMGSKNLKGVVVRNTLPAAGKAPAAAIDAVGDYLARLRALPCWEYWTTLGAAGTVIWPHQLGACGAYNYSRVTFDGIETASGASFQDQVTGHRGCYNCPVRCKATVRLDRGRRAGFTGDRGEFEPLSTWGPKCGNADGLESIYLCNLCDEYGLDSIGTGNVVAWAIDLYERGILTGRDTGGLELTWGNTGAMEEMVRQIATRGTRLGDCLGRGMRRAADIIGRGSHAYTHMVKGLSMTIMDPRGFKGSALGYAVGSRGADFGYVYAKPEWAYTPEQARAAYGTEKAADRLAEEGKPAMVKQSMCANAVIDSLGICKIPEFGMILDFDLREAAQIASAFTGRTVTGEALLRIGERIVNAERLFNFRFGATGQDDTLPAKFLTVPVPEGPSRGSVVHLAPMLREFYALMGWTTDGAVSEARKEELGLAGLSGDAGLERWWE